jgi:hypothetical protein
MRLTKNEFKQLIQANNLKIRYIENHITTREEYVENPKYDPNYVLGDGNWDFIKFRKFNTILVPVTRSWLHSEWWVCVPIRYRGIEVFMWFRAMFWSNNTQLYFSLDHIWNGGTGKKLRRDAQYNIADKLQKKALLGYYARPIAHITWLEDADEYDVRDAQTGERLKSATGEKLTDWHAASDLAWNAGYRSEFITINN